MLLLMFKGKKYVHYTLKAKLKIKINWVRLAIKDMIKYHKEI